MALILLYKQIGNAAFVGLALLLTLLPLNAWCGKKIAALDKEKTKVQDERVKFMNEIINGIKVGVEGLDMIYVNPTERNSISNSWVMLIHLIVTTVCAESLGKSRIENALAWRL